MKKPKAKIKIKGKVFSSIGTGWSIKQVNFIKNLYSKKYKRIIIRAFKVYNYSKFKNDNFYVVYGRRK